MIVIDYIGLIVTVVLIGVRYPLQALGALIIHEVGRIGAICFVQKPINLLLIGGAFGEMSFREPLSWGYVLIAAAAGPLLNYLVGSLAGGIVWERLSALINSAAQLRQPTGVIQIRLAAISLLFSLQHYWRTY